MAKGTEYRIKGRYMQGRFRLVCKAMGWNCEGDAWEKRHDCLHGASYTAIGYTFIQRGANPQKAYYRIVQIDNAQGGERNLSSYYTSSELAAWFDGILAAHKTLVDLHSNIATAVDSLRGNERFIATAIRNSL